MDVARGDYQEISDYFFFASSYFLPSANSIACVTSKAPANCWTVESGIIKREKSPVFKKTGSHFPIGDTDNPYNNLQLSFRRTLKTGAITGDFLHW